MSTDDTEYWEKVYSSKEEYLEERVYVEGNHGEAEFDRKVLETVPGKRVLDVGCGRAKFTARIGENAREVIGIDVSKTALSKAHEKLASRQQSNVRLQIGDASNIPFPDESFDVLISRRGPVTESMKTLREAYRVLAKGGLLMEITIGEKDKHNLGQIFGRGQMYNVKEKVAVSKTKMLRSAGFEVVEARDYLATEIFESLDDLVIRLKSAPIIPAFDVQRDRIYLERVERELKSSRGIETEEHRVVLIGRKKGDELAHYG